MKVKKNIKLVGSNTLLSRVAQKLFGRKAESKNVSTKFGGQPDWLDIPQWPIGRTSQKPMNFLCQIAIDSDIFPDHKGKVAYVFMDNSEDSNFYEPLGGDIAVIVQPGGTLPMVKTSRPKGPRLTKVINPIFSPTYKIGSMEQSAVKEKQKPEFIEVTELCLGPSEYPERRAILVPGAEGPEEDCDITDDVSGTKIGGYPYFIQDEIKTGKMIFLAQIDCVECFDWGRGMFYIFMDKKGIEAKLYVQF